MEEENARDSREDHAGHTLLPLIRLFVELETIGEKADNTEPSDDLGTERGFDAEATLSHLKLNYNFCNNKWLNMLKQIKTTFL